MKKLTLILIFLAVIIGKVNAQNNVYYTRNAILQVLGGFEGEILKGSTQELGITLDYETTDIILRLDMNKVKFNADSLNQLIHVHHSELEFKGALSLEHINTDGHPPQKFTIEGWLKIGNEKKKIVGKGELHHIDQSGDLACMLGLVFSINLDEFGIEIPNLENEIEVVIKQAILRNDKN